MLCHTLLWLKKWEVRRWRFSPAFCSFCCQCRWSTTWTALSSSSSCRRRWCASLLRRTKQVVQPRRLQGRTEQWHTLHRLDVSDWPARKELVKVLGHGESRQINCSNVCLWQRKLLLRVPIKGPSSHRVTKPSRAPTSKSNMHMKLDEVSNYFNWTVLVLACVFLTPKMLMFLQRSCYKLILLHICRQIVVWGARGKMLRGHCHCQTV